MRYFIDKGGTVNHIFEEHRLYCKRRKTSLVRYIRTAIRIKVHKGTLAVETLQKTINAGQLKAIRKLYREYNCFDFVCSINNSYFTELSGLKAFVK